MDNLKDNPLMAEWAGWLTHPATKALRQWANLWRKELKSAWEMGNFTFPSIEQTALKNAEAIGMINVLAALEEISLEQLVEVDNEQ